MCKVLNARKVGKTAANAVYVGRPSVFGNQFVIGRDGSREDVIRKYEQFILSTPWLLAMAKEKLKGKDLICWCAPCACHADVLIKIANSD